MTDLVLTVIGDDRTGLVSALSAPITAHGGSWETSQMARLGGKFAGILLVTAPVDRVEALTRDLEALAAEGLQVVVARSSGAAAPSPPARLALDLLGDDRPGIVADISAGLAEIGVSIEELATDVRDAPMAGGTLFEAHAVLAVPSDVPLDAVRARLEALADEFMVDLTPSDDTL